jgi:hypothetical protein
MGASNSWKPQGLSRPLMGLLYFVPESSNGNVIIEKKSEYWLSKK